MGSSKKVKMIPFKNGIVVNKNPLISHRRSKGRSFRVALFLLQNVSVGLHICPSFADCGGQCPIVPFPELDNVLCEPLLLQNLSIGLVVMRLETKAPDSGCLNPSFAEFGCKIIHMLPKQQDLALGQAPMSQLDQCRNRCWTSAIS